MDTNMNTQQPPNGPQAGWAQPAPTPEKKPIYKRWWFWMIIVIAAIIVIASALFMFSVSQKTRQADEAIESCQQHALSQAKYPGGAEIVSTEVGEITTLPNGNMNVPVEGEVDFPNGFGTPVRHTYWCGLMMVLENGDIINNDALVLPKN